MSRWKQIVRKLAMAILRIVLMLIVGLAIYFRVFEKKLIFYPEKTLAGAPHVPYENVHFSAADGVQLHGWFLPFKDSARLMIISHGNAGNIGDRSEMAEYVNREFKTAVLMYDYRGYGQSAGEPSETGLYSDLKGALLYGRSRGFSPDSVYLMGQSLGTAVTVEIASRETVGGVILEAPFTSVRGVARHYMFSMPVDYLLSSRFDSLSKIQQVHAPIAVVHGKRDPVIPFELGQRLFDAAAVPKKLFPVAAEIHEGALMALGEERTKELREFLFNGKH
jgi:fermentation-respiration switch protein FrsA (DUF1100 family)